MPSCNSCGCLNKLENYLHKKLPNLDPDTPLKPFKDLCEKVENDKCHYPLQGRVEAFKDMCRAAGNIVVHPLVHLIWIIVGIARLIVPPKKRDSDEFVPRKDVAFLMLGCAVCVLTSCVGQAGRVVLSAGAILYPPIVYTNFYIKLKGLIHPQTYSEFFEGRAVDKNNKIIDSTQYEKIKKEGQVLVNEIMTKLTSMESSKAETWIKANRWRLGIGATSMRDLEQVKEALP